MLILSVIILIISSAYYLLKRRYSYWETRSVPGPKPMFLTGNFMSIVNRKIHNAHEIDKIYNDYKGRSPVVGIYAGMVPALLIIDPGIAKKVMVTEFSHFTDTVGTISVDKESDPLVGRNPFFLKGDEWKEKRNEISPAFTNVRTKALFPIMQDVAERMKNYIKKLETVFDAKELCAKFTTDVVASAIYGAESGTFTQKHSEIREVARNVFSPSLRLYFIMSIGPFFPWITKWIKVKFCAKKEAHFLINLLNDAMKYRIDHNIRRQDYLNFFIELKKKRGVTDIELAAHASTFFLDGVETSALTLAYIFYELAKNTATQQKLRQQLYEIRSENGDFEYETLTENNYLEQIIYETLRLHPMFHLHARECTEDYQLKLEDGQIINIEKGTCINVPVYSIMNDPEHYGPDVNEFKPERFDGGLKKYFDDEVLLPFGAGPRICAGQRFAKTQIKCCVAHIITSFEISVSERMPTEPELDPNQLLLGYKSDILLNFKPID